MNTRKLISDDGAIKRYEVSNPAGQVVGYDEEPSTPIVDPTVQVAAAVQALTDVVVAKTAATKDDVAGVFEALDGLAS